MSIMTGRLTCTRFTAQAPRIFTETHLERLSAHAIGTSRIAAGDGSEVGWIAGDHVLDTHFDLAKNVVNGALQFALRIDTNKIPADLLLAYTKIELDALAKDNPSGLPSKRQRKDARNAARERVSQEAKDGRWLRRKAVPVLWDAETGCLLVGSTSANVLDRFRSLFRETFSGVNMTFQTAGERAGEMQPTAIDRAAPSFGELAWAPDESDRDFLGNEFLLWLWYFLKNESDTVKLADDSEVAVMLSKSLSLECPRGMTGKDSIRSDGPTNLPESLRAIQAGKLPRKCGMTLVRHDQMYELTLHAETLAIGSAKLPKPEGESEQVRREERVSNIRGLLETCDLLYAAFLDIRLSPVWASQLNMLKRWLSRREDAA